MKLLMSYWSVQYLVDCQLHWSLANTAQSRGQKAIKSAGGQHINDDSSYNSRVFCTVIHPQTQLIKPKI